MSRQEKTVRTNRSPSFCGPRLLPVALRTVPHVVLPDHLMASYIMRHSSASLQRQSCWGAYVRCDTWLLWHTCVWHKLIQSATPYPSSIKYKHTLTLPTYTQTCFYINRGPKYLHLALQINQSVSSAAHVHPAPTPCRSNDTMATSWITSSTQCIRFDGVKVLVTI